MFSKFKAFTGPDKFVWHDPDTGRNFREKSKEDLIQRIIDYRRQNKLEDIEYLDIVLENYWCSLAENRGRCVGAEIDRGFLGYFQGGVALLKKMLYESFVPQVVADRRALICTKCPHNVFPNKGVFVKWSDDIAEASTLGRKSKFHDELGSCEVCSCTLRAKVFIGGKIHLEKEWIEPMRKVNCWQLEVGKVNGRD